MNASGWLQLAPCYKDKEPLTQTGVKNKRLETHRQALPVAGAPANQPSHDEH